MDETALLKLPYIMAAQAQKHVTHNEALRILDAIVHIRVEDRDRNEPPVEPVEGQRHALGSEPTGAFAGHAGSIAAFQDGAWTFHDPRPGWLIWDAADGALLVFDGADWAPALSPQNLPLLGINTTADETNRLSVASAATLLSHAGAGHQLKINKAGASDTATLLLQTGWSGRAEMGLAGSDDFSFKVSADGETWLTALTVDRATGRLGAGVAAPQAILHAKAAANDSNNHVFRFDDAAGNSIWRAYYDGANFHQFLGDSIFFNLPATKSFNISGGIGLRAETLQTITSATDHASGLKSLRLGEAGASFATASQQLTKPNMAFRAWAWNGTNGFTLGTHGWFGLEQTAAVNGQAKFFWRMGTFAGSSRMELDHNGNLSAAGAVAAASFAKVGSFTVSTMPSASAAGAGAIIHVSDETGGATLAFSDGTDWRRVTDRAVVS